MRYKGHSVIITNGYYDVYYPEHPNARRNGCVMMQILVACEILKRPLRNGEVVHHRDSNRLNNAPENLMIFASQSDHINYHIMIESEENYVLYRVQNVYHCEMLEDFTDRYPPKNKNGQKMKICPLCGNRMYRESKVCAKCRPLKERRVSRPTRNELKKMIRTTPFTQIAKKFGITDNAVRKWCKSYRLPYKSSEIKRYTDEEWRSI